MKSFLYFSTTACAGEFLAVLVVVAALGLLSFLANFCFDVNDLLFYKKESALSLFRLRSLYCVQGKTTPVKSFVYLFSPLIQYAAQIYQDFQFTTIILKNILYFCCILIFLET